eukprot:COSAG01_NODE_357_length_18296_cov_18.974615_7_plen_84_part_00
MKPALSLDERAIQVQLLCAARGCATGNLAVVDPVQRAAARQRFLAADGACTHLLAAACSNYIHVAAFGYRCTGTSLIVQVFRS